MAKAKQQFRKGSRVWYIDTSLILGNPSLKSGVVRHYNPATEQSAIITKGRPIYTIETDRPSSASEALCYSPVDVVDARQVRSYSHAGKRELEIEVLEMRARDARGLFNAAATQAAGIAIEFGCLGLVHKGTSLNFFGAIDWKLLREQKSTLVNKAEDIEGREDQERLHLEGLVHLIDGLQDFAVDILFKSHKHVFGFDQAPPARVGRQSRVRR